MDYKKFDKKDAAFVKRLLDFFVAGVALILLSPLLLVLALVVRIQMGSPIFFRQERPGLHGHPFQMVKFRTMRDAVGENNEQLSDAERLTAFGTFMRAASFDELPELWNVIKGDMSLVGPRPLLMEYLPLYSPEQARRHDVRPGITGWAQVNGRNSVTWDEKFELDVWYVENQSLKLDICIIWRTLKKVIAREGINADGEATMTKFTGNDKA